MFSNDLLKPIYLHITKFFTVIFWCLLLHYSVNAQNGIISEKSLSAQHNYVIKTWNSESGLPQNGIISCLQTTDGFLWFSTHEGLVRFDGNSFKIFNTNNTKTLTSNGFNYSFEDSRHVLWLVNKKEKLVKYDAGNFKEFTFKESITSVCENNQGDILVSSSAGNIYKLENDRLSLIVTIGKLHIHKIIFNHQNGITVSTSNGLYYYNNEKIWAYPEFKNNDRTYITKDDNGNIWALAPYGLFKIENEECIPVPLPKEIADLKTYYNDFLVTNESFYIINTNIGTFIIKNNKIQKIDFNAGLSSNNTGVICKDKENNIWIGTSNAGINMLKEKTIFTYDKQDGLSDDGCGVLYPQKDKSVLISNYCRGLSIFKNGKFESLKAPKIPGCIWSLLQDKNQNLWLGTNFNGLYKINRLDMQDHVLPKKTVSNDYYAIFEDSNHKLWFGTENGVYKLDQDTLIRIEKELIKGKVSYIFEDRKNWFWICSDNGLALITNSGTKLFTKKNGLPGNKIRHIHEDKDGVLWISTYDGGIARYKNRTFFAYNSSEKIIDNFTSCIVEDDLGNLWISSNRGIYMASRKNLNDYADGKSLFQDIKYFGREDGMKNSECNGGFQYAGLKLEDGKIMFPTVSGVAMIDPKAVSENLYEPKVIIENILADEKALSLTDSVITLTNVRKLQIEFTAPFFGDVKNLHFECRLEGYDETWKQPSNERSISYYNLPPGDYIFKVAVYGYVNEKKIHFTVPYPFWQTGIFYIILAVSVTIIFLTIVYFRTRNIRQKETAKTEINKQYAALELKALQSQMNPHFMFNCLNTIKYFISVDDKSSANKYLGKFSKLIRLFLEHANSNSIKLSEELNMLSLYIEMEQLRLDNSFQYNLNVSPDIDIQNIEIPTMLLQPYVENAIHHGLRNKNEDGLLTISLTFENDSLFITIDDNGIGREKANEIKQASVKEHTSMGMKITAERIETLNYIKNTHIETEIIDKKDRNDIATGTSVIIRIPINTEHHD